MFVQEIYIEKADWHVTVYHEVDNWWADEIVDKLIKAGCRGKNLAEAEDMLWHRMRNSGLTYSNLETMETVMVIGITSSGREYWNTIDHEKMHLLQNISQARKIDLFGEEICYISGEFIREIYDKAKDLLCDCCRKKSVRLSWNRRV